MKRRNSQKGFTLIETLIGVAIFILFAVGIYGSISLVLKVVYQSRMDILETALLSEQLDIIRNLAYDDVGIVGAVATPGLIPPSKTVSRNEITFIINATVRAIDDPFDGTIGGAPNDTAFADYKLVELSAICVQCTQKTPQTLSTIISPKNLEGSTKNGALFIHVFDANGLAVSGANVHIVNNSVNPPTVTDDVTGSDGYLRIIDAPTGTLSYNVTVTKNGYSSDSTVSSTVDIPNPVRPPANVVSEAVTGLSFAIDQTGSLNFSTVNALCTAVPNITFTLQGAKYIGTDPLVYKYNQNFTTDGSGVKNLNPMEWDIYYLQLVGTTYDIAGATPQLPIKLDPAVNQNVTVVLVPHTTNSLLVNIRDAGTKLPLSDATVQLTGTGYDESSVTGLGYTRQTDWSGNSGQAVFLDETRYWTDDGGLATNNPAGDVKLKKVGNSYVGSGWLESSTLDLGQGVDFKNIVIEPLTQPAQTGPNSVRFQVATSNSSTPAAWNFIGPDGTAATYYTSASTTMAAAHDGKRYLRYRLYLSTTDTKYTPQFSEVSFTYTNSCTPPGQSFFNSLNVETYTLSVLRSGYASSTDSIDVSGRTQITVDLSSL